MARISAAIIGPGTIGQMHRSILEELGIPVLFVLGRNRERALDFGRKYGIRAAADYQEILESDVSTVHICTPPATHYQYAKQALLADKHVLCEKPLCLEDHEARELYRLAKDRGLCHATGFNIRYHEALQQAKRLIAHAEFGNVKLIHGTYLQEFHSLPAEAGWRYDPRLAGPMRAVTEIGSHWCDLATYLTGREIDSVAAVFSTFTREREVKQGRMMPAGGAPDIRVDSEDAATVLLRFTDGAIGSVVLSEASPGRKNYLSIEVTGLNHSLWWNSEAMHRLEVGSKDEGVLSRVFPFGDGFKDTLKSLARAYYRDVEQGRPSARPGYPTFLDGMRSVAVCNAIYRSQSLGGRWVTLERGIK